MRNIFTSCCAISSLAFHNLYVNDTHPFYLKLILVLRLDDWSCESASARAAAIGIGRLPWLGQYSGWIAINYIHWHIPSDKNSRLVRHNVPGWWSYEWAQSPSLIPQDISDTYPFHIDFYAELILSEIKAFFINYFCAHAARAPPFCACRKGAKTRLREPFRWVPLGPPQQ